MKIKILLFAAVCCLLFALCRTNRESANMNLTPESSSKVKQTEVKDTVIYSVVEQMPEFPGGDIALNKYIIENLNYADLPTLRAWDKFYVKFIVDEEGNVSSITVLKCPHPSLEKQAIELVKKMPKWVPAQKNGKPVKVWNTIEILKLI